MTRRDPGDLTEQQCANIDAAVLALPPLTDEQIDGLSAVLLEARLDRLRSVAGGHAREGDRPLSSVHQPVPMSKKGHDHGAPR